MEGGLPNPEHIAEARAREAAGDLAAAFGLFVKSFQYGDAARLAWQLGKPAEAAELCVKGGLHFEAATCFFQAGRAQDAVPQLMRVAPEHPRYRDACMMAIEHCGNVGQVDLRLDALLARWLPEAPRDAVEQAALYKLASLYQRHGFSAGARDAFTRLVARAPGYQDAAQRLAQLMVQSTVPAVPAAPVLPMPDAASAPPDALAEERAFRRASRNRTQSVPTAAASSASVPVEGRTQVLSDGGAITQGRGERAGVRLEPGSMVADRYLLTRKLGEGGMAVVFEAKDQELGETVAIKVFTQLLTDEDLKLRFKREVSLSRSLSHANIIRVYDIGTVGGHKYMTMELLSGTDMERFFKKRERVDIQQAVALITQVLQGLQYAHDHGVVHRDLKPANFFITGENVVKIMDFGIARDLRVPGHTAAGVVMGTPEYMSPEQFHEFNAVTHLTDIYAMGVVTYHAVTASLPFQHAEIMKLAMMHYKDPVPAPRLRNPDISPALEAVILRMLAKDPAERFQSAQAVAQALAAVSSRAPAPVL